MKKALIFLLAAWCFSTSAWAQKTKANKLVIVSFDGYRWKDVFRGADSGLFNNKQYNTQKQPVRAEKYWAATSKERREKLMPFFWGYFAKNGQIYGNRDLGNFVNVKNPYWFSYPGYNEIFTGYPDTLVNSNDFPPNPNVNVLEYINKQPGYQGKVAVFTSWDAYYRILNKERSGLLINSGYSDLDIPSLTPAQQALNKAQHDLPKIFGDSERYDAITYGLATDYLKQNHPNVLYLAFIETDSFGHQGKYDYYLDAAHGNDEMLRKLWDYLQSDPYYKDQTTLMIVGDHGRGDDDLWRSHGRKVPHSDEIWFAVMGPQTKPLGEISAPGQLWQNQYAQTIASFLGLKFPSPHIIGEPIKQVLGGKR
ncbi:LTA synthase family protein [Pedobacter sp. BS3]|uniref:alkaline phosphatase family protein n=1 Tax=Pedobacter sp. BS3 TaxID=2567937 RepID=UPI0011EC6495|nr:alkaline phosphatase family protein [Pedobacter sp. BS3]TZF84921.1 LTA synthase family protein [Pedobacter sp. BS3]